MVAVVTSRKAATGKGEKLEIGLYPCAKSKWVEERNATWASGANYRKIKKRLTYGMKAVRCQLVSGSLCEQEVRGWCAYDVGSVLETGVSNGLRLYAREGALRYDLDGSRLVVSHGEHGVAQLTRQLPPKTSTIRWWRCRADNCAHVVVVSGQIDHGNV